MPGRPARRSRRRRGRVRRCPGPRALPPRRAGRSTAHRRRSRPRSPGPSRPGRTSAAPRTRAGRARGRAATRARSPPRRPRFSDRPGASRRERGATRAAGRRGAGRSRPPGSPGGRTRWRTRTGRAPASSRASSAPSAEGAVRESVGQAVEEHLVVVREVPAVVVDHAGREERGGEAEPREQSRAEDDEPCVERKDARAAAAPRALVGGAAPAPGRRSCIRRRTIPCGLVERAMAHGRALPRDGLRGLHRIPSLRRRCSSAGTASSGSTRSRTTTRVSARRRTSAGCVSGPSSAPSRPISSRAARVAPREHGRDVPPRGPARGARELRRLVRRLRPRQPPGHPARARGLARRRDARRPGVLVVRLRRRRGLPDPGERRAAAHLALRRHQAVVRAPRPGVRRAGPRDGRLRYFTVYGPRQRPDMAFARVVARWPAAARSRSTARGSSPGTSPTSAMR